MVYGVTSKEEKRIVLYRDTTAVSIISNKVGLYV